MKQFIYTIIAAVTAVGLLASCEKSAVESLSGEYPAAEQLMGVTFSDGGRTVEEGFYVFSVKSDDLDLYFSGRSWYLGDGTYNFSETPASNALLARSAVGGKSIVKGGLTVYKNGDEYEIDGTVWTAENEPVQIKSHGKLSYEEVIITPKFNYVLSDYEDNGVKKGYNLTLYALNSNVVVANFLLISTGAVAQSYRIVSDTSVDSNGVASVGADLSALLGLPAGSLVLGSYFYEDGKMWLLGEGGTVEISGDDSMYSIELKGISAAALDGTVYSGDSKIFENAVQPEPVEPVTLTLEGWSAEYSYTDDSVAATREHKLSLKDSFGEDAGQIIVNTTLLGGINGSFEASTDSEVIGRYSAGKDYSLFGLGIIGSYISVLGTSYTVSSGIMTVTSDSETVSVTVTDWVSGIDGVNGLSLPDMKLTIAEPDEPQTPVVGETFVLEGCNYTLVSAPKDGMDGVMENTFTFTDASGNVVASYVEWTATGSDITGTFSYAATTATAVGCFAGGYDFFGMALFGSYYVRDGVSYLISAGEAEVSENDGKLNVRITGLGSAATSGEAGTATVLEIKDAVLNNLDSDTSSVLLDQIITSESVGAEMKYNVVLPPGYDAKKTYPFLYILHGAGDDHNAWLKKGDAESTLNNYVKNGGKPMVVVIPDQATDFWIDKYDAYFHNELIPDVEAKYHGNGKRAITGNSMGGFSTLYNAFVHPKKFTCAYSMSAVNMMFESKIKLQKDHSVFPVLILDCGKSDGICPPKQVNEFTQMLTKQNVKYELISRTGGHDWTFWKAALATALVKAEKTF